MKQVTIHFKGAAATSFDLSKVESIELVFDQAEAVGVIDLRPDRYGLHFSIRQPGQPESADVFAIDLFPGNRAEIQVLDNSDGQPVTIWSMPIQKEQT